jgi:hypothetical protein
MSIASRAKRITIVIGTAALSLLSAAQASALQATDMSKSSGIYEISRTRGATVFDYDGDGFQDALIGRHYDGFYRLYRNNRDGTFTEIAESVWPREERRIRDPHECASADVNQDGRADLYCTTGGERGEGPNAKHLYIQQPDGAYKDLTWTYDVADRWGRGRRATFLNANGDAYPDLFVGNVYPRKDGHRSPNRLFINEGGQRFRPGRDYHVDREVGANSVQAIDYNRDGRDDIFICGKDGLHVYKNIGFDHFRNVTHGLRARMKCEYGVLGYMNRDRRPDLIRVTSSSLRVHLFANGGFREPAFHLSLGGGREAAIGNVNGDGLDDVYYLRSGPPGEDRRDVMLLNSRGGHRFREMNIPQARKGLGEAVTTIDYDNNGLDDFIVENGHRHWPGPIRLVAFG